MSNVRALGVLPRSGRLFIAEAAAAVDVEQVRQVWHAARAAGEPGWYLDRIAAIGRTRSSARTAGVAA
ncbi:hypothetical protein [Kitasatospora sp. GP82]|uniref:hypothetical protein n=1 Tax=Kitasatospora sp. GP82 TaxID=3035089 RepID=UPI0024730A6E|nr:hypothetical protein [Kitasatospora sp. GP82]MDH6123420.1 hypothetical protein [Kitasatospora sp. GP82]